MLSEAESARVAEIEARHNAATPGPYKWDLRTHSQQCILVTDHSGQYYIMGFERWGFHNACPVFQTYEKYEGPVTERHGQGMVRADKLAKSIPGMEHHRGFDDYIDHPDAIALEHSWQDVDTLLALTRRLSERPEPIHVYESEIRDRFMDAVYEQLAEDGTNDRANTIIRAFDEVVAEMLGSVIVQTELPGA